MAYTSPNTPLFFWWCESEVEEQELEEERVLVFVFDDILLLPCVWVWFVLVSNKSKVKYRTEQAWSM